MTWTVNNPSKARGIFLRSVTCSGDKGQFCVAVGDASAGVYKGHAYTNFVSYTSIDGGLNWAEHFIQSIKGSTELKSVSCDGIDGKNCIAVGSFDDGGKNSHHPIIYRSANGGVIWSSYVPDGNNPNMSLLGGLNKVSCVGAGGKFCLAVGSNGASYVTGDGGNSWEYKNIDGYYDFDTLFCAGDDGYQCTAISSKSRIIAATFDNAKSWSQRGSIKNGTLSQIVSVGGAASAGLPMGKSRC